VKEFEMTLSQSFSRVGALVGAVVVSAGILAIPATPVQAAAKTRYYNVELAQPAQAKQAVVRGVVFNCEGTSCRAPISSSAPRNVCVSVAKEFGEVVTFQAGERALDASDLATCNSKTKVNIAKD
jgi:hypothetical protein